jgi:regulator of sigma E protease
MNGFFNLLVYLVAISVLVAVHEFGHFWVARRVGVKVLRFSIGMGKVLWSRPLKDGTEFAISAIPIGGYVSMLGERDDKVPAHEVDRSFKSKSPAKRIAVMAAGPAANFLFAVFAYWVFYASTSPGLQPVIGEVTPKSIAEQAGLRADDVVLEVNGKATPTREAVMIETLKDVIDDGIVDLRVAAKNSSPRTVRMNAGEISKELTKQDALLPGLGFDFWRPAPPTKLGEVTAGGPADQSGLRAGDEILSFDGVAARDFLQLSKLIQARADHEAVVEVRRDGQIIPMTIQVGSTKTSDGRSVGFLGIRSTSSVLDWPEGMLLPRDSIVGAFGRAVEQTWDKTIFVFQTVGYLIAGKVSASSISGPVGIATIAGEVARIGLLPFISLLALVSISIGALNLLPIPILDGGQIVFQVAELLKGRPVSERAQVIAQQVGIALLILLTMLAFYNDITRIPDPLR